MKNWYYIKLLLFIAAYTAQIFFTKCIAQDVITSSSGYYETTTISLSWTIGELAVETYANDNIILTQGFNQGNLIITGITEDLLPGFNITVYPNPVKDIINIRTIADNPVRMTAELYNLSGRRLTSELIHNGNSQIDIEKLPESEYILRIHANKQVIKSLKIIKTN